MTRPSLIQRLSGKYHYKASKVEIQPTPIQRMNPEH